MSSSRRRSSRHQGSAATPSSLQDDDFVSSSSRPSDPLADPSTISPASSPGAKHPGHRASVSIDEWADDDAMRSSGSTSFKPSGSTSGPFAASEAAEAVAEGVAESATSALGGWHYAPLLIALIPPAGALLGGKADAWSDAVLLILSAFWLYQFLRVPHDIYHAARTRRILAADSHEDSSEVSVQQLEAIAELKRTEAISLFACVASPVAGAWVLQWLMENLTEGNRYFNKFNIRLFMLAAGIKPWTHAFSLLRQRVLHLHEVVHYPSSRVQALNNRVASLETDIAALRRLVALKTDVSTLREGIDVPLTQLSRSMRRYEKKGEHLRLSAEDKFGLLEGRLEDLLREVAINAELIEEERRERERASLLPASIFQALKFALGQRNESQRHYLYDAPRSLPSTASLGLAAPEGTTSTSAYNKTIGPAPNVNVAASYPTSAADPRLYAGSAHPMASPPLSPSHLPGQPHSAVAQQADKPNEKWYSSGPAYLLTLPVTLPLSASNAAIKFANEKVRGAVSDASQSALDAAGANSQGQNASAQQYQSQQQQQPQGAHRNGSTRGGKMHSTAHQRRIEAFGKA
ncbi:hypothetical protein CBOM_07201 [Ceraceosorus bombacis]|uniref:Uncharacterized protein n=1 Tax=Ceraceosorus bombacis TaxID=401625 RepID=A0A0P1B8H1_9BASI|nr:hypothetical protein CBOM_07201 [Ceraceosorus bombacis]